MEKGGRSVMRVREIYTAAKPRYHLPRSGNQIVSTFPKLYRDLDSLARNWGMLKKYEG